MKKKLLLLLLFLLLIPGKQVNAKDYTLKSGKTTKASYAGDLEDSYNYFKIVPSKSGYIAVKVTTSNKQPLLVDICNGNKEIVASDIKIENKKTVLHKAKKGKTYYVRIKGVKDATYSISYKIDTFSSLTYAKKYNYTFTNASFTNEGNPLLLKIKTSKSGILNFMCNTNNKLVVKYYNSRKKAVSKNILLENNNLSGIGVKSKAVYYIKLWNVENSTSGTTTIKNIKYQIKSLEAARNTTRGKSILLSKKKKKEGLVIADRKNTLWYKIKLQKKQKLSISIESRLLQNNGSYLLLDFYNSKGKKITKNSIVIDDEAYVTYRKKKYVMHYPKKKIVTGQLPKGTYYIRVVSKSKMTSGSFSIVLN